MRIFDKLTGGGVDWQVELASPNGVYRPGDLVDGRVRFLPKGNMQVRSIKAALVGTEHYVYQVVERRTDSQGRTRNEWERRWFADEVFREEIELAGMTNLSGQTPGEFAFSFRIPAEPLASLDTNVLRMRWQVRAWMDVGGKDPATERDVYVMLTREALRAPDGVLAPMAGDAQGQIYLEPVPIIAGQQFRGYVDTTEQLDPRSVRVELKLHAQTAGSTGGGIDISLNSAIGHIGSGRRAASDERVLWTGPLGPGTPGQAGLRYEFAGALPPGPVATLGLPHGSSSATLDVVIGRRLLPDRHITRPVAIITG
jgi:hypothetical protein